MSGFVRVICQKCFTAHEPGEEHGARDCARISFLCRELRIELTERDAKIDDLGKQVRQAGDSLADAHRRRESAARERDALREALEEIASARDCGWPCAEKARAALDKLRVKP